MLIVKPEREEIVRSTFKDCQINITIAGKSYWSEYSYEKWKIGKRSLQAGRTCRSTASGKLCSIYVWTKTSMDVFSSSHTRHSRLLEQLENAIVSIFLPVLVDHNCSPLNARSCRYQLRELASFR